MDNNFSANASTKIVRLLVVVIVLITLAIAAGIKPAEAAAAHKIGIQAGHWNGATGTSCKDGTREGNITSGGANKTADILRAQGYTVHVFSGSAAAQFRWETAGGSNPQPGGNLARGKAASATSTESSKYPPSNGNDGSSSTRWTSRICATLGTEWWWVDLGSQQTLNRIVINWESAYASSFFVCWSNDPNTCYGNTYHAAGSGQVTLNVGSQTVRYLWLRMDSRTPMLNNYSLIGIEVFYYPNSTTSQNDGGSDQPEQITLPVLH